MNERFSDVWEQYALSWKVESRDEKLALYNASLNHSCRYTDPLIKTVGWDALVEYMLEFHQQIPGGHFVTTWFLAHNNKSIAKWEMQDGGGNCLQEGISYGEYGDDEKLMTMTGFFELPDTN